MYDDAYYNMADGFLYIMAWKYSFYQRQNTILWDKSYSNSIKSYHILCNFIIIIKSQEHKH